MRAIAVFAVAVALSAPTAGASGPPPPPSPRPGAAFSIPLYGTLVKTYDAPLDNPYAAGHRADNIAAPIGTPVRSSADGVVGFAGNVAGNLSVSVDHTGGIKTTYSYLGTIVAKRNQHVLQGEVVGTVGPGHDASLPPNVQLSARRNGVYFDPLELYVGSSISDLLQLTG
jgi:murein DD-endopeptidase MepM/ murein hydrolase activator NlpD